MSSKYERYESDALKEWKKISSEEQLEQVIEITEDSGYPLEVKNVKDQMIEVNIFVEKNETYELLKNYEKFLREKLNNIPIIVLLKERLDENRKRK